MATVLGTSPIGQAPETPADWIEYLGRKLDNQAHDVRRYDRFYDGDHPLQFAQVKFKEAFGGMFEGQWADNFCALVVDSVAERLQVEGFRMTEEPKADKDAWRIWQRNGMDADSDAAHIDSLLHSASYVTVWGDDEGQPLIIPESADKVAVAYDPVNRRKRTHALRRIVDDWGVTHTTLWTPKSVYTASTAAGTGVTRTDLMEEPNPLKVVPVVPLLNRPRLNHNPGSELKRVIPIQNAINKVMIDAIVASEVGAFPMRWVTGLELADDETMVPFRVALDKMLHSEDPNTKFGQFDTVDLQNYVYLITVLTTHLASISRIPTHYFLLQSGQPPSGESIKSAEAGLVAKVRQRHRCLGEGWEEVQRLSFAVLDDPRQHAYEAEVIWRDPEYRTEGEHIDSLLKKKSLNVPDRQLQEDAGYTPGQIDRFAEMRDREAEEAQKRAEKYGVDPGQDRVHEPAASTEGNGRHLDEAA